MAEYYNVTTNLGDAEIANAIATNTKLNITHIAFGDGNGSVPTPTKTRTSLVKEVHRQAVTKYTMHPTIANYIVIETIIPSNIGGFWIREMGIIADNVLISHGSHAPFFKVADPDGVSEYRLKFTQNVLDGNVIEISLDESLIYASQAWVNENYIPRSEIVDNLTTNDASKPVSAKQAKLLQDKKIDKDEAIALLGFLPYMPTPYPKAIPPDKHMAMMGQALNPEVHPILFSLYGPTLPDQRAYSIRGLDYGRGIDVGRVVLSEQQDEIKAHTHDFSLRANGSTSSTASNDVFKMGAGVVSKTTDANGGAETRVKNIAYLYIVREG